MTESNPHQKDSKPRLNNFEVEEKATSATEILHHPVFQGAMDDIYSRAEGILLSADIGSLTASSAHAIMKAVTDIHKQLEEYVTDDKMRKKFHGDRKDG